MTSPSAGSAEPAHFDVSLFFGLKPLRAGCFLIDNLAAVSHPIQRIVIVISSMKSNEAAAAAGFPHGEEAEDCLEP